MPDGFIPAASATDGACAASLIGAAASNAPSAVPMTHRYKIREITGNAPMRRMTAGCARTAVVEPRMAFLRRPRKNGGLTLQCEVENLDVAASWRTQPLLITCSDNS